MEASGQFDLDLRPGEMIAGRVLDRIRRDSRDEAAKGRLVALAERSFGRRHTYRELAS